MVYCMSKLCQVHSIVPYNLWCPPTNWIILAGHKPLLSQYGLKPGFFEDSSKDVADIDWKIFKENIIRSIPWLILHSIGTQFCQRSMKNLIPIFHTLLPMLYFITNFGVHPVILLLAQPLAIFLVAELFPHTISGTYLAIISSLIWQYLW